MAESDWEDITPQPSSSEDDWEDIPSEDAPSPVGSAVRGAAHSVGAGIGAGLGMAGGAALGALTAPVTGPIGAIGGAVGGGVAGGMAGQKVEDWLLNELGMKQGTGQMSDVQQQQDVATNPKSTFGGQLLGSIGPSFGAGAASGIRRAIGGGIQGGLEAAQEKYQGEDLDPAKIGMAGIAGAAAGAPRKWVNKFEGAVGARLGARGTADVKAPAAETPPSPDVKAPPEGDFSEDIPEDTAPQGPPSRNQMEAQLAREQMRGLDPSDPLYAAWQSHAEDMEKPELKADGQASTTAAQNDGGLGTAKEAAKVNDTDAGNEVGAPMQAREAAKPHDPVRDYEKDSVGSATDAAEPETPSTKMSVGDRPDDITAAVTSGPPKQSPGQAPEMPKPMDTGLPQRPLPPPPPDRIQTLHARNRGQDQEAPPGTLDPNRPAAPQAAPPAAPIETGLPKAPVTAAETPPAAPAAPPPAPVDPGLVTAASKHLDTLIAAGKLPPEARAKFDALHPEAQAAVNAKTENLRAKRVTETGVGYRDKADQTRKEGAVTAVKSAVQGAPEIDASLDPSLPSDRTLIQKHAGDMWDAAQKAFGGKDPIRKPDGYMPNLLANRLPEHNVIKAARALAMNANPSEKAFTEYLTKLADKGAPVERDVEAATARKGEAPSENVASSATVYDPSTSRPDHTVYEGEPSQKFLDRAGYDMPDYVSSQGHLRNWLNGLSDADHAALMGKNPDLVDELNTTHDPVELQRQYAQDLAATQGSRPGTMEYPSENPGAPAKRTPIRNAADLDRFAPTAPNEPVAVPKRTPEELAKASLKGSPEYEALAAKYGGMKAPDRSGQLESGLSAGTTPKLNDPEAPPKTASGRSGDLVDQLSNLMTDTRGGGKPITDLMPDWMKNAFTPKPKTPEEAQAAVVKTPMFAPKLPEPSQEYAEALGGRFVTMRGRISAFLGKNIANSAAAGAQELTPAENGQISREFLQGRQNLLSGKLKDYNDTYVKPLAAQHGPMYDEARDLAIQYMPKSFSDLLPARKVDPNGIEFMPRKLISDPLAKEDNVDPVAGQQGVNPLYPSADTMKPRDWFTLQNTQGQRVTYKPGDGQMTFMRNGAPSTMKVNPSFDPTDIGSTIKLKVGGKSDTWTVGNSTPDEIVSAAGKNPDGTNRMAFHDDPAFLWTNANNGLKASLEKLRLVRDVSEDPRFQALTTTDRAEATEKGWIEPALMPQFKGKFMPPIWAHTMDDFVQQGFVMKDPASNKSWDWLGRATQALNKPFFFFGPLVHDFNIFNNWAIGRGFKWVQPGAYRDLAETASQAIKSVRTQDGIQDEIREAGGNMMYMHSVARNAGQQVAENLGIEIAKNPSKWDPIAKMFGTTGADMGRAASVAYQKTSNFMWHTSDYMYTQRYLEAKANGMSPADAVKDTEKFIMNYRMPTTLFGSRLVKQLASSPQLTMFAPWHYGVLNAWGHIFSGGLGRSTKAQRVEAAGQFAVAAGMTLGAYPAMTAGYRAVTGDKDATIEPRGMSAIAQHVIDVVRGNADVSTAARQVYTPSIALTAADQAWRNQDYRGKPIIDQQKLYKPANAAAAAVQGADWAGRTLVPPYGQVSNAARQPGATALGTAGKFAEGMVGITDKSAAAEKRQATIDKIQNATAKAREKNPPGLGEKLFNYATGR